MTERQKIIMRKADERLNDLRSLLDEVMYRTDELPDDEFNKIRSAYDELCSIRDRLF